MNHVWSTVAYETLKATTLFLLRFTVNSYLALNILRASIKVCRLSTECDSNMVSLAKRSKETLLLIRSHIQSDLMILRIKDYSSSIYNPNKVEERGQPCFTPMVLKALSKNPYEVQNRPKNVSCKAKIATKPSSSTPKLFNRSMGLCQGIVSKAFLKSTKQQNTRDF